MMVPSTCWGPAAGAEESRCFLFTKTMVDIVTGCASAHGSMQTSVHLLAIHAKRHKGTFLSHQPLEMEKL